MNAEGANEDERNKEGDLVGLVWRFRQLIVEHMDLDAKKLYEETTPEGRTAILNAVPGYVTLIQRRYGLRVD
jgi:hypothetical protein